MENVANQKFSEYLTMNYLPNSDQDAVTFATQQSILMPSGTAQGHGINYQIVDTESYLRARPNTYDRFDKLTKQPRIFKTVPYLGKGMFNPTLESQLLQGEPMRQLKSVSTTSEQSYLEYRMQPENLDLKEKKTILEFQQANAFRPQNTHY
jgi:hypothetical protein